MPGVKLDYLFPMLGASAALSILEHKSHKGANGFKG
jgi:hypothetical protein